jgi:small GTP-binding protein
MVDSSAQPSGLPTENGKDQSGKNTEVTFKVLMIGDSSVGKTASLARFAEDTFPHSFISTVGIDYKQRVLDVDGVKVRLSIWDTAGQERFRTLTNAYYRGAHGVVIMYDITNRSSFLNVPGWITDTREYGSANTKMVLVGNKVDRPDRDVPQEDGEKLAKVHRLRFFETSALEGTNCDAVFEVLSREMLNTARGGGYDTVRFCNMQTSVHIYTCTQCHVHTCTQMHMHTCVHI